VFDHDGDGNVTIDEFLSAVGRFVDGETPIDDAIRRAVDERTAGRATQLVRTAISWLADNRMVALWLVWLCLGAAWGMASEGWTLIDGAYFAVGALATGGLQAPALDGQGVLPAHKAVFVALYCLTGIPIHAMALGQFANIFVERQIVAKEKAALRRPITRDEFEYAQRLFFSDGKIDLSEFMALELLRLDKIDAATLASIKREFERLDRDGSGELDAGEIETAA